MKKGNELRWAQVVMAANAPMMTKAALVDGRTDVGVLPTGQVVGVIDEFPTVAELVDHRHRGQRGTRAPCLFRGSAPAPRQLSRSADDGGIAAATLAHRLESVGRPCARARSPGSPSDAWSSPSGARWRWRRRWG